MKNVILYGVHTLNVGDDLFFKILIERYPNSRFIMYAPKIYKQMFGEYKNCIVYSETDSIVKFIKRISLLFHIPASSLLYFFLVFRYHVYLFLIVGGSLFIEGNSNIPGLLLKIKKLSFFCPKLKVAIVGSNFGPSKTGSWREKVEYSLSFSNDVCFRDLQSFELFSKLKNVRWGNDIVMHMDTNKNSFKKQRIICINIRSVEKWPLLKPYKEQYLNNTISIINHFHQNNYKIRLLSFCEQYGDNEITEELYNRIDDNAAVEKYYYRGNLSDMIAMLGSAEYIVATRFHAIVLGLVYNLKVLPISYSIKTENMLKTYNIWDDHYDFNHYCNSHAEDLLSCFIEGFTIDKSHNTQFDYIDRLLQNNNNTRN